MARKKRSVQQHEKTFIHIRKKAVGASFLSLLCLVGAACFGWLAWFYVTFFETARLAGVEMLEYQLDGLVMCFPAVVSVLGVVCMVILAIFVFAWGWTDKTFVELLTS